ncbi:MAG: 23S rRNA (adenine(2503)-C(2))-methyltransferase RlmN [Myxococcota bacterium]
MIELVGLPRVEFYRALGAYDLNAVQASRVWRAIYVDGARSFDGIENLGRAAKQTLTTQFKIGRPGVSADQTSTDGTRKWLMRLDGGHDVETVFIPHEENGSLCVSSQVGCTLACSFCHTGTMPLLRNLKPAEIVGQMLHARDVFGDWERPREERIVSNIVMMGMGEPLYNYPAVRQALSVIMDGDGIALSKRRIVLSTSGIVPMIERCGKDLGVELAISLHAVTDALRDELVPINKKWPIAVLLDEVRRYPTLRNTRRILFEYVMLDGVNDTDAEARELVRLLEGIPSKVNLIPFNPWPGSAYAPSPPERISAFAQIVRDGGIGCPVREPRGRDILAACGQLKSATP